MPSVAHLNQFIAQVCVNLDALLVPHILEISASIASDLREMVDFNAAAINLHSVHHSTNI